jgi:hypothetical protein
VGYAFIKFSEIFLFGYASLKADVKIDNYDMQLAHFLLGSDRFKVLI